VPIRSIFLDSRFFVALGVEVVLFVLGFFLPELFPVARVGLMLLVALVVVDFVLLYGTRDGVMAARELPERLSNGDVNTIGLVVRNRYRFAARLDVIDEIPFQFQVRDFRLTVDVASGEEKNAVYELRPTERGEYSFGAINIYAASPIGLVRRRYTFDRGQIVPVYPSFLQLRRYELMAHSNRLTEVGVKKVRRVGQTLEFDQIRDYVMGDDLRLVNWAGTARSGELMVNQYQDERTQYVYSIIDKGRAMRMPFEGMTLLDYAINASLVISGVALNRGDRAGLVTFSNKAPTIVAAERKRTQMNRIMEVLYNQTTEFLESAFDLLYATVRRRLTTRSLVLLYTNFETMSALQRQLPYLRGIARNHLLVVIFFQNSELLELIARPAEGVEAIYRKAIAEKFVLEKKQIVRELQRYGIHAVLTTPKGLTVDAINKYLEIKARRLI
jgi:uncharacterized protein (DUF58 family)